MSPLRQRLGDRAVGTVVISANQLADPPLTLSQQRQRAGIVAGLLVLFLVACLAFSYFGRPPIAADAAMRLTSFAQPSETAASYHLGAGRRSA